MNTFKRFWKRSKSRVYAVLCMIALISINCIPLASAAEYTGISQLRTGSATPSATEWTISQSTEVTMPLSDFMSNEIRTINDVYVGFAEWYSTPNSQTFTGNANLYLSYYVYSADVSSFRTWNAYGDITSPSSYTATYTNSNNTSGVVNSVTVDTYTPNVGSQYLKSDGVSITAKFRGSEDFPINSLRLYNTGLSGYGNKRTDGNYGYVRVVYPSVRLIVTQTSAELDALDSLASEIANQSQILEAMKGDIVGLLQQIYTSTGNLEIAFDLLNGYMQQLIPLINSINNNTSNIYSLLSAQFALLSATISTESQNIQDAIEKQTEDLKTYFDDVLGGAVGTLPDDSASADDIINESHDDEQQYHSDALNRFNELSASFNGFNGDVGSGIALVGTLFSRVWGALGNYVIVYTFPLLLGLALVITGRLGRGIVKKSSQDRNADE